MERKIINPVPEEDIFYEISNDDWKIIYEVVDCKIKYDPFELVKMTHEETPWISAYKNKNPYIDKNLMRNYFKNHEERIYE